MRHWICSECGAEHDRDINAALNILAAGGHPRLDGGILALQGE
ncbi:zinc ribbon domain-containing protein [Thiolapillus sp.]|nr:zinc ribbon domain-containing protein [Thiolapillus sp.]